MKKISVRKVETLKTTAAMYACASCDFWCDIIDIFGLTGVVGGNA